MLKDLTKKYFIDQNCNCAHAVFYAVADDFNIELTEQTKKVVAPFGGGMGAGCTCGALTGAVAAIGLVIDSKETYYKDIRVDLLKQFKERFQTFECVELTPKYKKDVFNTKKCYEIVEGTLEILDNLFDEYLENSDSAVCSS